MTKSANKISGSERAAIFMMSLGEQGAAQVFRHMGPREVQKVGTAMAALKNVPNARLDAVLGEFAGIVSGQSSLTVDTDSFLRNTLKSALGEDKASSLIDRILTGDSSKGLESLKWMAPSAVAEVVKNEHPQIIAIVLSYLESDHAAEVLRHLPERARPDVLMRIATLDGVAPAALQELNAVLEKQFSGGAGVQASGVGGIKVAAGILNFIESSSEAAITEVITEHNAALAQEIQDQMFVFDNLVDIDDRGMQAMLREIQSDSLIIALKGAGDDIKEKIFSNMSTRAAEMMREDLDAKGPVRLKDVEEAQKAILTIARRMADAGELVLGGMGDDEYV